MTDRLRAERLADQVAEPMGHRPPPGLHPQRDVRPTYDGPDLGPGRPLHAHERARLEPSLGVELAGVRVHADDRSAELTEAYGAAALSTGQHVLLGRGHDPTTPGPGPDAGERAFGLLAHEVAHTVQHRGAPGPTVHRQVAPRTDGIGRTPPPEPFVRGEAVASEDTHLLFGQDDITISAASVQRLVTLFRDRTTPVQVDVNGYSSTEGDDEYNVNLSAWRAAAVSHVLTGQAGGAAITLPAGSRIRLVAHGESTAFGTREQNRRAGVRVTALPAEPPGEPLRLARPATGSRFGLEPLRLDPSLLVPPVVPGAPVTPLPPLTRPGVAADPGGEPARTPVPSPRLTPSPFVLDRYGLPGPTVPPLTGVGVNWPGINSAYSARGVRLTDRDQVAIQRHFQTYYPLFVRSGLPPDKASSLMNALTASFVERELARENPNVADRFESEFKAAYPNAVQTPTLSVDVFDLIRRLQR